MLFSAIFLALWFFANWFEALSVNDEAASAVIGFIWIAFNASFVVLSAVTAIQVWNEGRGHNEPTDVANSQPASPLAAGVGPAVEGNATAQTHADAGPRPDPDGEEN